MATTNIFLKGSITNIPRKEKKNVIKTAERQNKS